MNQTFRVQKAKLTEPSLLSSSIITKGATAASVASACHLRGGDGLAPELFGDDVLFDDLAAEDMLLDDPVNLLLGEIDVHRMAGLYEHHGPLLAAAEAAGLDRLYGADDAFHHQLLCQMLEKLLALGVVLADTAGLGHPRRGALLALENVVGGLRHSCLGHGNSLILSNFVWFQRNFSIKC